MARGRPKREIYSPPAPTPRSRPTRSARLSAIKKETPIATPPAKSRTADKPPARRGRPPKRPQANVKRERYQPEASSDSDDDKENSVSSLDEITSDPYEDGKDLDDDPDFDFTEDFGAASSTSAYVEKEEIFCPWIELSADQIAPLTLPESSVDLLIESELLISAVEVYELCLNYYRVIQISPFLFEDFCCALRAPEQSSLMAEIHIAFIRLLFRDDEDNQTTFSVQDTNNCFNVMLQLLDGMTYAEVLRYYVESEQWPGAEEVAEILKQNYPFVDGSKRIVVLRWLCDRFLETYMFRQLLKSEGKLAYDDICRDCGKAGEVVLCDGCDACYHLECTSLNHLPDGCWYCPVCEVHAARGAVSLKQLGEMGARHRLRVSPLGHDRHGRVYWFFAKRLFIQDPENDAVYYYSSLPQVYEVVRALDPHYFEKALCEKLAAVLDEISTAMRSTMELTRTHRAALAQKIATRETPPSYLDGDNSFRMVDILAEVVVKDEKPKDTPPIVHNMRALLGFENGHLTSTFWSGDLSEPQLLEMQQRVYVEGADGQPLIAKMKNDNTQRGYRLAFSDGKYRSYVNEYAINDFAKSARQRTRERDRRKYLSLRFALTEEGEFTWHCPRMRDIFCSEENAARVFQLNLKKVVDKLPEELLHRRWPEHKQEFVEQLQKPCDIAKLRHLLLLLERIIRKPVFSPVWWNSLGLTKLSRVTTDMREERMKLEQRRKKDERALQVVDAADPSSDVVFVKYLKTRPASFSLWRLKDEAYRLNNRGQMGGWLWVSTNFVRRFEDPVKPDVRELDYFAKVDENTAPATRKVLRLERLAQKLAVWREAEEMDRGDAPLSCYSPNCRLNPLGFSFASTGPTSRCYNSSCPRRKTTTDTSAPAKAYKDGVKPVHRPLPPLANACRMSVLGEGRPFRFPQPHDFLNRRSGKRSLLVLPQPTLRRLARQGGLNGALILPGFNKQAKSNTTVWNYPCPRPLFDNCWRFVTLNASTVHALALSLRVMYSCIRWADMEPPEDTQDPRVITHFPDHDERRAVISHKEHPPDGYYEQYKLSIQHLSIDDDNGPDEDLSESFHLGGSSNRTRKRKAPRKSGQNGPRRVTNQTESWADGVDLKLYEIRNYWMRFKRQMAARKAQLEQQNDAAAPPLPPPSASPSEPPAKRVVVSNPHYYGQNFVTPTYRLYRDPHFQPRALNGALPPNAVVVRVDPRSLPAARGGRFAQQSSHHRLL